MGSGMMTSDEYILHEYLKLQDRYEDVVCELEELRKPKKRDDEFDPENPGEISAYRVNDPIDLIQISFISYYSIDPEIVSKNYTSEEIQDIISTDSGVEKLIESDEKWADGSWSNYGKLSTIHKESYPYQIAIFDEKFAFTFNDWSGEPSINTCRICKDSDPVKENRYYTLDRVNDMKSFEIKEVRKILQEFIDKKYKKWEKEQKDQSDEN